MHVEARLGRAESAPDTGKVDDQVCSVESATDTENEHECEIDNRDEDALNWIHENMKVWGDEVATDPLPRGGVGDARVKEIKQEETSSCAQAIRQARFSVQLDAARCSDKLKIQEHEEWEMSNEAIDAARRSVDESEGDPMRYNALARVMQQPALAVFQRCASVRPNVFRSVRSPRSFRPIAYRAGTPS